MKKLFDDDERTPFAFALLIIVVLTGLALAVNDGMQSDPNYYDKVNKGMDTIDYLRDGGAYYEDNNNNVPQY